SQDRDTSHHTLLHFATPTSSFLHAPGALRDLHSFPTRRSSDLRTALGGFAAHQQRAGWRCGGGNRAELLRARRGNCLARQRESRSEEHTSELQSLRHLVCRLLLEKKKNKHPSTRTWLLIDCIIA